MGIFLIPGLARADETLGRLLVFTSPICAYCTTFMKEVGGIYPKSSVGRKLPMTEVDLTEPGLFQELAKTVCFTPTFVILDNLGKEKARFRGYRSDESFWGDIEGVIHTMEQDATAAIRP